MHEWRLACRLEPKYKYKHGDNSASRYQPFPSHSIDEADYCRVEFKMYPPKLSSGLQAAHILCAGSP